MPFPGHSLHKYPPLALPCAHLRSPVAGAGAFLASGARARPHAPQMLRLFPCSQMPFPGHSLQ